MSECKNPETWMTCPYIIPKSQDDMFNLIWNVDKDFATGIKAICLSRKGRIYEVVVELTKDHETECRVILEFYNKERKVRENYDYRSKNVSQRCR